MSLSGQDRVLQQYWRDDMGWPAIKLTLLGGYAVRVNAYQSLTLGQVVAISTGGGSYVLPAPVGSDMPIGAVYQDATSSGFVWVVTGGIGYVKPMSSITAAAGSATFCSSSEAGRVNQSTALPAAAYQHRQVGHFLADGSSAGSPALAIIHFH